MLSQKNITSVDVIDPCNRTGKITIPLHHIIETRGLSEYQSGQDIRSKDLSLCLLFQKGRCNAGARCHQIHAQAGYVDKLRSQAANCRTCCALHGDCFSIDFLSAAQSVTVTNGAESPQVFPLCCFSRTLPLEALIRNGGGLRVPKAKICRLHSDNRCKFGRDCKNFHLCPDAKANCASVTVPKQPQEKVAATMSPTVTPPPQKAEEPTVRSTSSNCGLSSVGTPTKSLSLCSSPDLSPADRKIHVPSLNIDFFVPPLMTLQPLASPANFVADGFEDTLSLVVEDLINVHASPLTSPYW
jgi:hypothetical protein